MFCEETNPQNTLIAYKNRFEQFKLRLKQQIENEVFIEQLDIECTICYNIKPIKEFIECDFEHKICKDCLKAHGENTIIQNGTWKIKCIGDNGLCDCLYEDKILEKVLSTQIFKQHQVLKIKEETRYIHSMEGINLVKCQFCETYWDIDPNEKVLTCRECNKNTCLDCNQLEHKGRPCDKIRIRIEESMTRNNFLVCSNCSRCIFKESGCDAIRCPCGNNMCWACKRSWGSTDAHGCSCNRIGTNHLQEFNGNVQAQKYIRQLNRIR